MTFDLNNTANIIGKNLFKNPVFGVIQGTASGTIPNSLAVPTVSLGYLGEAEWCIAATGGTPAYAISSTDQSITITGASGTTAAYILQRLESRDTNKIKNKTVTLSVELSNSLLTSVIWEVFRATTSNDTHGTITSPTQTLIASGTFTVSSTLTRYNATFDLPDLASRGLEVRFRVGAQTSGTWVIARPKLEVGSIATDFSCDDFALEFVKCQRYYRKQASQGQSPTASFTFAGGDALKGGTNGGGFVEVSALFAPMFSVPTVVISDAAGSTGVWSTNAGNGQGYSIVGLSDNSFTLEGASGATFAAFRYQCFAHIP